MTPLPLEIRSAHQNSVRMYQNGTFQNRTKKLVKFRGRETKKNKNIFAVRIGSFSFWAISCPRNAKWILKPIASQFAGVGVSSVTTCLITRSVSFWDEVLQKSSYIFRIEGKFLAKCFPVGIVELAEFWMMMQLSNSPIPSKEKKTDCTGCASVYPKPKTTWKRWSFLCLRPQEWAT